MFLSNSRKSWLLIGLLILAFDGCSAFRAGSDNANPAQPPAASRFPFPTREPAVYQGFLFIGNGSNDEKYFVARKDDRWRFDTYRDGELATTQLRSNKVYVIDHAEKTYFSDQPVNVKDFDADYFNSLSWGFFRGANYLDYEEIERAGGKVKYRAKTYKDSKSEVLVTIDEASGIMVRQEITDRKGQQEQGVPANFIYEVRDLQLTVEDSVFDIPSGYRQIARPAGIPNTK